MNHVNVDEFRFAFPFVDEVGETIASLILIWWINLRDITNHNDFSSFTCAGYDSLNLVRCKVLGFIDDDESLSERTSSDVVEDENFNLVCSSPFSDRLVVHFLVLLGFDSFLNDCQIIVNWHHVRINFLFFAAWEESKCLVAHFHCWTCYQNFLVGLVLLVYCCS